MTEQYAIFAGGCFWCMEPPFNKIEGVIEIKPGYTGGNKVNPTYEEVCSGETGHVEAIQILYEDTLVSFEQLLDIFWQQIDPTDDGGQFADRGSQYKTAIFYTNKEQKEIAEKSIEKIKDKFGACATEIIPFDTFYEAEEQHHKYYKKNPISYKLYKVGSGRESFIKENWKQNEL